MLLFEKFVKDHNSGPNHTRICQILSNEWKSFSRESYGINSGTFASSML